MISATIEARIAPSTQAQVTEVEAPGPDGPLRGTMVHTAIDAPTVLIIPGSGPTDRDGNNPHGVRAAPYRLLAEGLAGHGIGSVRIDKRGMFGSQTAVDNPNAATIDDYVRDTRAWIEVIRSRTGAERVWLLGHSEGGLVALAAAKAQENVSGVILVAAPGRPLGEILKEQLRANPAMAPLIDAADHAIDELTGGRRVNEARIPPELAPLFSAKVQGFLISAFSLDPADLASKIDKPILIFQGQRDLQVSVADAERLKNAAPNSTLVTLPDTDHVLKRVSSVDRDANIATYLDGNLPLVPEVMETVSAFVKSR
ncbi:MAG: alpha/beta hydrolase [Alphaproteobacteria bacterium]|nr:alpha/beta hydrolase [Alphaproteobacteria bacterium]